MACSFIIVSGPFKTGKEQWPIVFSDETIKDWTEEVITYHFPSAQIKRFDFLAEDASAEFWSKEGFTETATRLLDFINQQGITDKDRHLVFISHGFGGTLVKKALAIARSDAKYASIPAATRGLLFFATPHRTDSQQTWEDIVFRMLCDIFHDDRLKLWKIRELAHLLRNTQLEYGFIRESWPTVNVCTNGNEDFPRVSQPKN